MRITKANTAFALALCEITDCIVHGRPLMADYWCATERVWAYGGSACYWEGHRLIPLR